MRTRKYRLSMDEDKIERVRGKDKIRKREERIMKNITMGEEYKKVQREKNRLRKRLQRAKLKGDAQVIEDPVDSMILEQRRRNDALRKKLKREQQKRVPKINFNFSKKSFIC